MELRKIYEYALQREREGKRFFEEHAGRMGHAAAVGAFKMLADEEQKHIEFIQQQLDALDRKQPGDAAPGLKLQKEGFFSERAAAELLERSVLEAMVADLPVLRTAYLIERDFAEFYASAARQVQGPAREVLEMLARWETGHAELFKSIHDKAFEEYSGMAWGG
ncbi:MAG: ferritin family protein [Deltaproteobacteria bacterium]|nr:ferritin family protein [Deltaproteobacteria bacterium]